MDANGQGSRRILRGAARLGMAGALLCGTAIAARAETLNGRDISLVTSRAPLSPQALAALRGRYVASDGVVYFGLQIVSRWTQANGSGLAVGTNVGLSLDSQGHPHLSVGSYSTQTGGTGQADTSGQGTITGNPISGVSGIGQGIQTTGNDNVIKNVATINLVSGRPGDAPPSGGGGAPDLSVAGGAGQGRVVFGPDSVIVAVNVPGQGVIQQTLGAQGLGQSAQVLSSANNILNQMSLSVGFAPTSGFSAAQVGAMLGTLKGL